MAGPSRREEGPSAGRSAGRVNAMRNVFVVGLDDVHRAQLERLPGAGELVFHPLFTAEEIRHQECFPVARLLDEGIRTLVSFPDRVDAVVGYWDFPVSTTLPLLRQPLGLPGPSLGAVLQCEHKYWSRIRQADVVPAQVPAFCLVDPFAVDPRRQVALPFPFWLKPVKSVLSHLGFRVDGPDDFTAAIAAIRSGIARYAAPFDLILARADLPPEIAEVHGSHCIAEAIISSGSQCTQEGFAFDGVVEVYGTVDSFRDGPARSSFSRYQYPSSLPAPVVDRMSEISRRVITHLGYDTAPFNIEYFWDPAEDRIWLLEINARLSKSHAPLFLLVDGGYHHQVMVDLGLGRRPRFVQGRGPCRMAAKFMVRRYADEVVTRAPSPSEIATVQSAVPFSWIQVAVHEGMRLCDLRDQDSYSYEVATIFVGGDSRAELEARFHACMDRLPLRFAPLPSPDPPDS